MLREYPCPSCGYTINSWAQRRICPRCDALLPEHYVDLPLLPEPEVVTQLDVDYFQRRRGPDEDDDLGHDHVPWWGNPGVLVALATFLALLLLGVAIWLVLDSDGDGMSALDELREGTSMWTPDSDGDTLSDGWELRRGTDALHADSDGDGLSDLSDLLHGGDPLSSDTDGDLIPDGAEAVAPVQDCDGDGIPGIRSSDDDSDGRPDAMEPPEDLCRADSDGDGLRDGAEGSVLCIHDADCDEDGVADGAERAPFSALDPDSLDVGLPDAVSLAFQDEGQPPSRDLDHDGIPDGWESSDGRIEWGDLRPVAGERDLLVEFVRVVGPDSGRHTDLDLEPAIGAVVRFFGDEGQVRLRHVTTTVTRSEEPVFPPLPTSLDPLVADVLERSRYAGNPFVTTVLVVPQDDQSGDPHSGVAPIRGMLAAVDLGAHVLFTFHDGAGLTVRLAPSTESFILGNQSALILEAGFDDYGTDGAGLVGLRNDAGPWWLVWEPRWFRTTPELDYDNGTVRPLVRESVFVGSGALAGTLAHELGHTLGLCHTHDAACQKLLAPGEAASQATSVMSYDWSGALEFLPSEWERVRTYVTCPPAAALGLVAEGATTTAVIEAKYAYTPESALSADVRSCGSFAAIERTLEPALPTVVARHPMDLAPDAKHATEVPFVIAAALVLGAVTLATLAGFLVGSRRPQPL